MPKYFCEYCGIFLTHSSPWGRKQHSHGRKHINNKIEYYSQFIYEFQQNKYQSLMEMAQRAPQMNPIVPPRMMPPIGHMPPPMQVIQSMQGFPPGMQPMPGINHMIPPPIQNQQNLPNQIVQNNNANQ